MSLLGRLKERFRGREAWRSLNTGLIFGVYTLLIIGMIFFPRQMGWVVLILGIVLPSYGLLFVNHLREMEKRDKGNKLILGWITHGFGIGEPIYFTPTRFQRIDKLSPEDLETIQDYVDTSEEYAKAAVTATGLDKFKPKQLSYDEISKKEAMNKEDMKKLIAEETAEIAGFIKDFKEIIHKNNNIVEDEPKDGIQKDKKIDQKDKRIDKENKRIDKENKRIDKED